MKTCIKLINEVISDYREALDSVGPRLCYWYTEKERRRGRR